jgi:hypothetical protein
LEKKLAVNHFFFLNALARSPQDDGNCVPLLVRGDRLKHALDALQSKRTNEEKIFNGFFSFFF